MSVNKKILFVCTGNTCRSPMAEIILKNKLKLAGITDVKVSSAGLSTLDGQKMSRNSAEALKILGYKPFGFRSRQVTEKMLNGADIIICMTEEHKNYLRGFKNVYTVMEASGTCNVPDPYGGDLGVYIKTSHVLEDACNEILKEIIKLKGERK